MMSTKPGKKEDHGKSLMEASSRQTVLVKSAPIPIPLPPLQLDPLTFSDCCEFPKAYPQCCRCKTCSYISKTMMETSSTERGTVRMKSANIPIPLRPLETDPPYFSDCYEVPKPYPDCCRCKTCSF